MFVTLSDGSVRNTYEVRLRNKHGEPRMFGIHVSGDLGLGLSLEGTPYHAVGSERDPDHSCLCHRTRRPRDRATRGKSHPLLGGG